MKTIMKTTWEIISALVGMAFWIAAMPVLIVFATCVGIKNAFRA